MPVLWIFLLFYLSKLLLLGCWSCSKSVAVHFHFFCASRDNLLPCPILQPKALFGRNFRKGKIYLTTCHSRMECVTPRGLLRSS